MVRFQGSHQLEPEPNLVNQFYLGPVQGPENLVNQTVGPVWGS
jgi:hypothetical protein